MLIFLIVYIVYVLGFIGYSLLGLYHLYRYGYIGDLTKPIMVVYSIAAIGVIFLSIILIAIRPWPVELFF